MSGSKANKIRQIVRLQQLVKKWHKLANAHKETFAGINGGCGTPKKRRSLFFFSDTEEAYWIKNSGGNLPQDVPEGYLAVYVGEELKRFIIPMAYLNYPVFKALLEKAEEEFGFSHKGALTLPCDTVIFEHLTWMLAKNDPTTQNMDFDELINFYRHEMDCGSEAKVSDSALDFSLQAASAQKNYC